MAEKEIKMCSMQIRLDIHRKQETVEVRAVDPCWCAGKKGHKGAHYFFRSCERGNGAQGYTLAKVTWR